MAVTDGNWPIHHALPQFLLLPPNKPIPGFNCNVLIQQISAARDVVAIPRRALLIGHG
jgi:hypothetical protein